MAAATDHGSDLVGQGPTLDASEIALVGEAARWAPSIHNSQPWHLRRLPDGLAVLDDPDRAVAVIDPRGRDRAISCGSAVLNARVALRSLGYVTSVEVAPGPAAEPSDGGLSRDRPRVMGVVRAVGRRPAGAADLALAAAVRQRHTHRRVYRSHAVAEEDLLELGKAVLDEGARLSIADAPARRRIADLLREAVRGQAADAELRREVEGWVRRRGSGAEPVDGIPSSALGTSPFPVDSLVHAGQVTIPDVGEIDAELARSTVLAISTREDTLRDWVVAGMALERMLLTATVKGLVATFTDQALQSPEYRPAVAEALGIWDRPQVLLRVGRALVEAPPTPRRPLAELFAD